SPPPRRGTAGQCRAPRPLPPTRPGGSELPPRRPSPGGRTSSARWSNTGLFRRVAGYRRYNAPSPTLNSTASNSTSPKPACPSGAEPACPGPLRYVYARFGPSASAFERSGRLIPRGPLEKLRVVMGRLVMKFGGTSVANIDRIRNVARHVKREVDAGHEVA